MKSRNAIRIGVTEIEGMVEAFETGRITRRQLVGGLGAVMVSTMAGVRSQSAIAKVATPRTSMSVEAP